MLHSAQILISRRGHTRLAVGISKQKFYFVQTAVNTMEVFTVPAFNLLLSNVLQIKLDLQSLYMFISFKTNNYKVAYA